MNADDTMKFSASTSPVAEDSNTGGEASRRIRSFVRREGRMTRAQRRAFAECWARFGVDAGAAMLEPEWLFGRRAPLVLEIGFGDGESLVAMAMAHPEMDYLGIEIHRPGIGHVLLRAEALELSNLRIMCADAVEVLRQLPDESLARIQIFFPDPWPKTRHHKRRLIQSSFVMPLVSKLKWAGQLHVATDCEDYAHSILNVLRAVPELTNAADGDGFAARPAYRPLTRFERRGRRLGHEVWDVLFARSQPGV